MARCEALGADAVIDHTKPLAAQLKTLLSASDIRLLLGEEIDPMDFVQAA